MTIDDNIVMFLASGTIILLLMRFVNAVNEIDNADELRIHRSYWWCTPNLLCWLKISYVNFADQRLYRDTRQ